MSSASAEKIGTGQFQVWVNTGPHSFIMDEPLMAGGLGAGPNPFDMLCAALASCTLMTIKLYADRKGWKLEELNVHVTHHKDLPDEKDRFDCVVELGNVTDEQRERILSIARRCPVHLVFERGADVPTTLAPDASLNDLAA